MLLKIMPYLIIVFASKFYIILLGTDHIRITLSQHVIPHYRHTQQHCVVPNMLPQNRKGSTIESTSICTNVQVLVVQ